MSPYREPAAPKPEMTCHQPSPAEWPTHDTWLTWLCLVLAIVLAVMLTVLALVESGPV